MIHGPGYLILIIHLALEFCETKCGYNFLIFPYVIYRFLLSLTPRCTLLRQCLHKIVYDVIFMNSGNGRLGRIRNSFEILQ